MNASATTTDPVIREYADRCDEHLRDLPDAVRRQLRDDIEQIVAEVSAELGGLPDDLVGPPRRFVTELRTAAGLAPPPEPSDGLQPTRRHGFAIRVAELWGSRAARWCRALAPELRPAWWVARGLVLAVGLTWLTGADERPRWFLAVIPTWPVLGSHLVGAAVAAGAVYLSVEAGRRRLAGGQRAVRAAATAAAVAIALVGIGEMREWTEVPRHDFVGDPGAFVATQPGFMLVTVGSDLTGESRPVVSLEEARAAVQDLLVQGPPAAIYIDHQGTRTYPSTAAAIDTQLAKLAGQGFLSGPVSDDAASSADPGGVAR